MNCLECTIETRSTPSVGICSACGAGACAQHGRLGHAYEQDHSLGNPSQHRLPGRRFYCGDCADTAAVSVGELAGAACGGR